MGFNDEENGKSDGSEGQKPRKWSPDVGYDEVTPIVQISEKVSYPYRTFITGIKLQVKINYSIPVNPLSTHCFSRAYVRFMNIAWIHRIDI